MAATSTKPFYAKFAALSLLMTLPWVTQCGRHDQAASLRSITAVDAEQYYDAARGKSGEELRRTLTSIVSQSQRLTYGSLKSILPYTDEDPRNPGNMLLIYSGRSISLRAQESWNREHVWPQSHGLEGAPGKSDLHHIRPCENQVNSTRGDKDFGELNGTGEPIPGAPGTYVDPDQEIIEPRDEVKGDIARMLFFMDIRYEGVGEGRDLELVNQQRTRGPRLGRLDALLKWHEQDPVDEIERQRNQRIYEHQENRNPFIDHPEWVSDVMAHQPGLAAR